ncbi:MAG: methyltransferase [Candidatus Promineifilaceae bacterium]
MKIISTDDVFDLMESTVTSAALNTALELGLFWLLAEQPMDTTGIAQTLGIPVNRCQYWLQLLSNIGLVEQSSEGYVPSSVAQNAILKAFSRESWAFLAEETRDRFLAVNDLALHIREIGSAWAAQGLTSPDYFAQISQSPEKASRFTRMLFEIHLPLAERVAESLDLRGVNRLMDLGGGSGVISLALLRRNPHLSVTVVDIASVCEVGRAIAAENSLEDRITYHPADFLREELPSGFDMVLSCDVGPLSETLFLKIRAALNRGGRLVIIDQFAPNEGVAPSSWLYWAFLASLENPDFTLPTETEVQKRLKKAGFQLLSIHPLPQAAVRRWSSDLVLMETRK